MVKVETKAMGLKPVLWGGAGALALAVAASVAWVLSLPPATPVAVQPPLSAQEAGATLSALGPPKRKRPLIAIIGINDATETTDYLMPYGILRRADVADVVMVATGPGPVKLYPALTVEPDATVAAFDQQYPQGADYVIVPAMSRDDAPAALEWIRSQAQKGATVIGVCAGAMVVGAAGLLDGKRATTHWYFLKELLNDNPSVVHIPDRRFVVDQKVATTTGITASMPMMLTLIEAIAGRDKADAVARGLGLADWDARHDSSAFKLTRPFAQTVLSTVLAFWNREQLGIELTAGMDEASLALVADAWSRTYRSRALTFAASRKAITTRNAARILPDAASEGWHGERLLPAIANRPPAKALDDALQAIERRYGARTADLVAMQLEYPERAQARESIGFATRLSLPQFDTRH